MTKYLYSIGILFSTILYAQDPNTVYRDFNKDKYVDTLTTYHDDGTGFGGKFVTLINGKTNEKFELDDFGCYCDIKKIILIPPELDKVENGPFLNVIKGELLPKRRIEPDMSLQWLITANRNHKAIADNDYFDLVIWSPPKWTIGEIKFPETYYVDVNGNNWDKLYTTDTDIPTWYNPNKIDGWLIYYGHNHKEPNLTLADSNSKYKAYKTSHGIVLKKGDSYAWIFITDYRLTGGPEKLRWESIGSVKIIEDYVFLELINSGFSSAFFLINIEDGIAGRLKSQLNFQDTYAINNQEFTLNNEGNVNRINVRKLIGALDKFKKN